MPCSLSAFAAESKAKMDMLQEFLDEAALLQVYGASFAHSNLFSIGTITPEAHTTLPDVHHYLHHCYHTQLVSPVDMLQFQKLHCSNTKVTATLHSVLWSLHTGRAQQMWSSTRLFVLTVLVLQQGQGDSLEAASLRVPPLEEQQQIAVQALGAATKTAACIQSSRSQAVVVGEPQAGSARVEMATTLIPGLGTAQISANVDSGPQMQLSEADFVQEAFTPAGHTSGRQALAMMPVIPSGPARAAPADPAPSRADPAPSNAAAQPTTPCMPSESAVSQSVINSSSAAAATSYLPGSLKNLSSGTAAATAAAVVVAVTVDAAPGAETSTQADTACGDGVPSQAGTSSGGAAVGGSHQTAPPGRSLSSAQVQAKMQAEAQAKVVQEVKDKWKAGLDEAAKVRARFIPWRHFLKHSYCECPPHLVSWLARERQFCNPALHFSTS